MAASFHYEQQLVVGATLANLLSTRDMFIVHAIYLLNLFKLNLFLCGLKILLDM